MCGLLGSLTGLALMVLVLLHPVGWLVLIGILCLGGFSGVLAFINALLGLGKK